MVDNHEYQYEYPIPDSRISKLNELKEGWDGYDAPVPNDIAYYHAYRIVMMLDENRLKPNAIKASADGGIALIFVGEGIKRAFVEILNTNEIYTVLYDLDGNCQTIPWPKFYAESIDDLSLQITWHLHSIKGEMQW